MYIIVVKCDNSWQIQTRAFETIEGAAAEVKRLTDCSVETKVVKVEVQDAMLVATAAPRN